jgi:hypothetical protein
MIVAEKSVEIEVSLTNEAHEPLKKWENIMNTILGMQ